MLMYRLKTNEVLAQGATDRSTTRHCLTAFSSPCPVSIPREGEFKCRCEKWRRLAPPSRVFLISATGPRYRC